jgi:hypothetical protein
LPYNFLADLVVVLHAFFVLFVVLGGFLVLWRTAVAWFHVPAVLWGAAAEFFGWLCPLTHLEFMLRQWGGRAGYDQETGFVEYYIVPILYPATLTRKMQVWFGVTALLLNSVIYLLLWHKIRRTDRSMTE